MEGAGSGTAAARFVAGRAAARAAEAEAARTYAALKAGTHRYTQLWEGGGECIGPSFAALPLRTHPVPVWGQIPAEGHSTAQGCWVTPPAGFFNNYLEYSYGNVARLATEVVSRGPRVRHFR